MSEAKVYIMEPASCAAPNPGQYWALWKQIEGKRPGLNRHAMTARILGCNPKPQAMTSEQMTRMLQAFRDILACPAPKSDPAPASVPTPAPAPAPVQPSFPSEPGRVVLEYFSPAAIASVLQCSRKTIHRRATEEGWPRETVGHGFHYSPGPEIAGRVESRALPRRVEPPRLVAYADIANDPAQAAKVERRRQSVEIYHAHKHLGRELALSVATVKMREAHADFPVSPRSLRDWVRHFADHGLNGLVEQKRGAVGCRPVEVPAEFVNMGKAMVIERGSVARAARELALHPDLPSDVRRHLHGAHASKSYVTPSIRRAIDPAQATKDLIQGPRHARLHGRFTPCDYAQHRAGDFFCSDDMTSNIMCWVEWPNAHGWKIGQAQVLPVLDVRSLRWLNVRLVIREGGQYNSRDDIWGLFGDTFDQYGRPRDGFVLEGGHWASNVIRGVKTGLSDDIRIGGLESIGINVHRSYDPRSKIIEGQFNLLQHEMDRFPGFVGRDQRRDLSEAVKKRIALLKVKHPQHHPREFFPHVSQLADQVKLAMENQNHERQDGQLLRGLSPLELWAEHNPQLESFPDAVKWMYRSAFDVVKVTCNGVRLTRGSGAKLMTYYYDAPELLVPRQGTKVSVYWNDGNPATDAVLRCPRSNKFIGLAKFVQPLSRFGASPEELAGEAKRKATALHYAHTEARAIQPELVRASRPLPVGTDAMNFGAEIAAATERQAAVEKSRARVRRAVDTAAVAVTAADRAAMVDKPSAEPAMSRAEIHALLS